MTTGLELNSGGVPEGETERILREQEGVRWEGRLVNGRVRYIRFESVPRLLEDGDTDWSGTVSKT